MKPWILCAMILAGCSEAGGPVAEDSAHDADLADAGWTDAHAIDGSLFDAFAHDASIDAPLGDAPADAFSSDASDGSQTSEPRWFGYFGSDFEWLDPARPSSMVEVAQESNVVWISGGDEVAKLTRARQLGLKAILYTGFLFDLSRANALELRSDWREIWSNYAATYAPFADIIVAVYPLDEPFWNYWLRVGCNSNFPCDREATTEQLMPMVSMLNELNAELRRSLPQAKTVLIEAYPMVRESLPIPSSFDWVGMDCYGPFANCQGRSIDEYYAVLRSKVSSETRLVLLPPTLFFGTAAPSLAEQQSIAANAALYFDYATNDARFVAAFPYLFQNVYDGASRVQVGASEMSVVRDQVVGSYSSWINARPL